MRKLLIVLLWGFVMPVSASHIVGGEFELLYLQGNQYRLNLIYYFDVIHAEFGNANPEDVDRGMNAYIYRKSDRRLMTQVLLPWRTKVRVGYTQPDCAKGEVITDKLTYSQDITLVPEMYNDPGGYYVIWQRCCRNYFIDNVVSDNPNHNNGGTASGQIFYLEFPAVVRDGKPFINSSPKLFPPLNDYACPNKPYYVDFAGVDDDGDSLVYSLVVPLSTTTAAAYPAPSPGPYPDIVWETGFDLQHVVNRTPTRPTNPDLKITTAGFLTVTPRLLGLFTFAVKIEEFRNKEKIGESRRDFQLPVIDCNIAYPPKIIGRKLAEPAFAHENNMSVSFLNTVSDDDRCIVVSISDPDADQPEGDTTQHLENVGIRIIPLNFKNQDLSSLLPARSTATLINGSTTEFRICFPKCPFFQGGPYQIGIIAIDDACALPLTDTLKVQVEVEPPANERVEFVVPNQAVVTAVLQQGDQMTWPFEAHDAESDALSFFVLTNGFSMEQSGMTVEVTGNGNGVLSGQLTWDADCELFNFSQRTSFDLQLLVDDDDICNINKPDTVLFKLTVLLPGNADPIADTNLTVDPMEIVVTGVERKVFDKLSFKVWGYDSVDNDFVSLRMVGKNFSPAQYGMTFEKVFGKTSVNSTFNWDLLCDRVTPSEKDVFHLQFLAIDTTNFCRVRKVDTVTVEVRIFPPDNTRPHLEINNLNPDVSFENNQVFALPGQPISLELSGIDPDVYPHQDELLMEMIESGGSHTPAGFEFSSARGPSILRRLFTWNPDCSIFTDEIYENDYHFTFRVADDRCHAVEADTVKISVKIKDVSGEKNELEPPNVFTPNGDGINDYYSMERMDPDTGELVNVLPPDNCTGAFQTVRIYNRWGKTVFTSTDRNFRWYGNDESAGVYYYFIKYTNREFKGTVSLRN